MSNLWWGTQRELKHASSRPIQAPAYLAMRPLWRGLAGTAQRAPWPPLDHVLQVGVVALMTVVAAAMLVTHQAPSHTGHVHKPVHVAAVGSTGSNVLQAHVATLVEAVDP